MIKIGITGIIGSGKSQVSKILETMNFPVYNSDIAAKRLMLTSEVIRNKLVDEFGKDIYQNNQLNKDKLRNLIFSSTTNREFVNKTVHPVVLEDFLAWCKKQETEIVFLESAIMFENDFYKILDDLILVISDYETIISRIVNRDNLSQEIIKAIINSQMSYDDLKTRCKHHIINEKDQSLVEQVLEILQLLKERSHEV